MDKTKKYQITLTEEQLMLMAHCVEDCSRFAAGQTELYNVLRFIARSYHLYREIYHQHNLAEGIDNVYTSETLRCKDSGESIQVKVIDYGTNEKR